MTGTQDGIQLARDGVINRHNYDRLGFDRVLRGVYCAVPPDVEQDQWARRRSHWLYKVKAVMSLYPHRDVVLYGATALQALDVQLPERLQDWSTVHILVGAANQRPKRADVVAHCSQQSLRVWKRIDGLPVLHPVAHWLQMTGATLNEMVEIGDGFLRRRNPLLTLAGIRNRLGQSAGTRGIHAARRALELIRPGTDSIYESRTRMVLINAGLPMPAVNLPVWCASVDETYHVDMGYVDARTAVEFDGLVHVGDRVQMTIDADRRRNLQDAGWVIITVTAAGLRHSQEFLRSVENALIMRTGRWQ
ncbi:MAG: hypothetical protein FWD80_04675 [Propionibacteriaceae bacterium]|nr:hypothetical protein [Propionibacteriaceae bacterium]